MRRLMIALSALLIAAGAAAAGWHLLRPRDPLAEARQYMANGNARAAELVLRAAVQADPTRAEAHFRLGQVQLRLGDPVAAERELRSAADRGWDAGAVRPVLAQAVVAQHRDAEVLQDYRPDGLPPDRAAMLLIARAQAALDLHRPEEAAAAAAEAIRLMPDSVEAKLAAAQIAMARGDRITAEALVGAALAIDPHGLEALLLRARLQAEGGELPGAVAAYSAAIDQVGAQSPGAVLTARLARASLLAALGRDVEERADLDAVLKAQPKQPVANFLLARLLAKAADWKASDIALLNAGPLVSRLPNGDLLLALVKANLNQPEQAIEAVQRQLSRTPDSLPAVKLLARLEFAQKRPDLAAKALASAPGHLDAEALELLGEAYAVGGKPADALQALQQARISQPDDARLLTRLAVLELRLGEAGQAVEVLEHALDAEQAGATSPAVVASLDTSSPTSPPASSPVGVPAAPGRPGEPTQAQTAATLVMAALRAGELDRAAAALDRLQAAKVEPAEAAMLNGSVKMARADFAGARTAFEAAGKLDPRRIDAPLDLARVMALQGDVDGATAVLRGALAGNAANVAIVNALINLNLAAGQTAEAVAQAEAAHKAAPDSLQITAELGALYLATNQPQQALDLAAGANGPGREAADIALRPLRARAELALGHRAAAVTLLRPLLEQAPDNAQLRRQIADLLANEKDFDGARLLLREGLARHPGDPNLIAGLVAVAGAEGGPAAALARAEELARDPAIPGAAVLKGEVLMSQGRYGEAAAAFHAQFALLASDDPRGGLLKLREAQAVAASGKADDAATMLRTWLAAHPDNAAGLMLSSLDLVAKRVPQARSELEAVLAHEPNNVAALNNLAWIRQQQGDLAGARAMAARANLLASTPQTADTLGWIVLAQGDVSNALPLLRAAAQGARNDPTIAYHYAAALARNGQKDAAVTRLKSLLDNAAIRFDEKPDAARLLADLQS